MPLGLAEPLQAPWLSLFRCWITSKHVLVHYITNCGYFGLIFLFNMAIFGVVTWKSCYLQGMGAAQGGHKAWKVALVAVGLFCLLGATWALAFLTYSTSSAPILYLFTILNSLQGEGSGLGWGRWRRRELACQWADLGSQGAGTFPALSCPSVWQRVPATGVELVTAPNHVHTTTGGLPPRKPFLSRGTGTLSP